MSSGLVSMLLFLSNIQSNGGVSWFLKTLLFILFGLLSYICLYFSIVFFIQLWVYFVVILRACVFAILAISTSDFIHSCWSCSSVGSVGMVTFV